MHISTNIALPHELNSVMRIAVGMHDFLALSEVACTESVTISTSLQDDWTDVEDVVHFYSLNGHGRYLDVTDFSTRGRALEHGLGKNVFDGCEC